MGVDDRGLPVAVMGPPDLLLTCVVDALRARGYDTTHLHRTGPELLPDGPGVVIVDLDRHDVGQVARAVSAGWTLVARLGGGVAPRRGNAVRGSGADTECLPRFSTRIGRGVTS